VTAYSDDPMQGSTIVDTAAYRAPEIASVETPPKPGIAQPVEPQRAAAPSQTAQAAAQDGVVTRVPYPAFVEEAPAPQSDTQSMPSRRDTAEADDFYRQRRDAEYRRMWREATAPFPEEDVRRERDYRRPPPDDRLPFPGPRERVDPLN
jgi:hypothetical protein